MLELKKLLVAFRNSCKIFVAGDKTYAKTTL
jgi:hypothetical protein